MQRNSIDVLDTTTKRTIREVLGGSLPELKSAFCWSFTPQGYKHWADIWYGNKRLSKRSRQYLNKLASQSEY